MNMPGNPLQSLPTVISAIKTGHRSIQSLGRTNIGRSFLPLYMLFTGLQSQTQSLVSLSIQSYPDNTSRNIPFIFLFCCQISSVRTTISHRYTKTLGSSDNNIRTPFSGRYQQYKTHQICSHRQQTSVGMNFIGKSLIISDFSVRCRILYQCTENLRCKLKRIIISINQFYTLRSSTGNQNIFYLRKYLVIHKQFIRPCLFHFFPP